MTFDWQTFVAIAVVAVAAGYLGYTGWSVLVRKRTGGCGTGSCTSCPASKNDKSEEPGAFVSLDQLGKKS